jgi:hypothetical protein
MKTLKDLVSRIEQAIDKQQHTEKLDGWMEEFFGLYERCCAVLRQEQAKLVAEVS